MGCETGVGPPTPCGSLGALDDPSAAASDDGGIRNTVYTTASLKCRREAGRDVARPHRSFAALARKLHQLS